MTNLKCSVENCKNYCEHRCCLSQIEVAGHDAQNRQETCCNSFSAEGEGACNSSCRHDDPNKVLEIRCSVESCIHNEHGDCDADCVCVGIGDYDTTSKQETQCETFAVRKPEEI